MILDRNYLVRPRKGDTLLNVKGKPAGTVVRIRNSGAVVVNRDGFAYELMGGMRWDWLMEFHRFRFLRSER